MPKENLTKHNFALNDDELATVRYVASQEHRNLTGALRAIVRDYHGRHSIHIKSWQQLQGQRVEYTDADVSSALGFEDDGEAK